MLISGVVIEMFYLERGGGGGAKMVQNYFLTNPHLPLLHSRLRARKKKQKAGVRGGKPNQFGNKSDPGIAVMLQ